MGAVAFNTYELIKTLEKAGMSEKQAEAITTGILRAHEVAGLATKADLRELQAQTKADLREEMAALRTDLQELRAETKADLQAVKTEIRESQAQTKAEMRELELRMTIKLGSMMIIGIGVLTAVIKFL